MRSVATNHGVSELRDQAHELMLSSASTSTSARLAISRLDSVVVVAIKSSGVIRRADSTALLVVTRRR